MQINNNPIKSMGLNVKMTPSDNFWKIDKWIKEQRKLGNEVKDVDGRNILIKDEMYDIAPEGLIYECELCRMYQNISKAQVEAHEETCKPKENK